jgi:hypothetical protein
VGSIPITRSTIHAAFSDLEPAQEFRKNQRVPQKTEVTE